MQVHTAYICVGSNLGAKLKNCRKGIAELTRPGIARLIDQSYIYKTEPVDYHDQDWFINYVVKIETTLDPLSLLDIIESVEHDAGRIRDEIQYGPRVLDLDIILYDDIVMNHERLVIPHPRMHRRRFVLKPICDIDPCINHPVLHRNMQTLLENLAEEGQRITALK